MVVNNIAIKMLKNLPSEIRPQITDLYGRALNPDVIDPFALVCIEIKGNPGSVESARLLTEGQTTYDYFKKIAQEKKFDTKTFVSALQQKTKLH